MQTLTVYLKKLSWDEKKNFYKEEDSKKMMAAFF